MDTARLRAVGEALFGARWQMPLARVLVQPGGAVGVDISLLQRWVSGDRPMPGWLEAALLEAVRAERRRHMEHAARLEALEAELG